MASDIPATICRLNKSIENGRVCSRFFDAKIKRHGRFTSDLVGLWERSVPNGATIFSRMRAPVRPLRHAEVPPRHGPSATSVHSTFSSPFSNGWRYRRAISRTSRQLHGQRSWQISCPYNEAFKFVSFPTVSNQSPKPGLSKMGVNRLKWRRLTG
jgi:hypothetical protein